MRWSIGVSTTAIAARADGTGELGIHFQGPSNGTFPPTTAMCSVDWSPDGRSVAFDTWSDVYETESRIHVLDLDSGIARQLIPEATGAGVIRPYHDFDSAWSGVSP
jgi:hypothetical protein